MEAFLDAHHPKFMYHATKPPVQVFSQKEIEELGPEWSETYMYQEYPKCRYHWNGKTAIVQSLEEELALGGGWASAPVFEAYRDPERARPKDPNPLKWTDQWSPTLQSPEHQRRIKAELLKAHAAFWKSPDYPSATADAMRQAFTEIAAVLFDAGLLTETVLKNDLPDLVWDSAVAGGWWHLASETPADIFPRKIGHHWVWPDENRDWPNLLWGEMAEWTAKLLESGYDFPAPDVRDYLDIPKPEAPIAESAPIFTDRERAPSESDGPVGSPDDRLQQFIHEHPGTTLADVKHSANVHTPEFQDWRQGRLKTDSVMSQRIEAVLSGTTPLKKKPRKRRAE